MTEHKRATLALIEEAAIRCKLADRGRALLLIVVDHVDDDGLVEALRVLRLIPIDYFTEHLPHDISDETIGAATARLIEVLGLDFWRLALPAQQA